jgi:hypothetical protein
MSADQIKPVEEIKSPSQPSRRNLLVAAIYASIILYFLMGAFGMFIGRLDFMWLFIIGFQYLVQTLPFTFLTIWVYRIIRFPPRFEFLAAVVIVGIGSFTVNLISGVDLPVKTWFCT